MTASAVTKVVGAIGFFVFIGGVFLYGQYGGESSLFCGGASVVGFLDTGLDHCARWRLRSDLGVLLMVIGATMVVVGLVPLCLAHWRSR